MRKHSNQASVSAADHCPCGVYFRFPLSLRPVEEILLERGIVVSYETIRLHGSRDFMFKPGRLVGLHAIHRPAFDVSKAEWKPVIEPDRIGDDLGGKTVVSEMSRRDFGHCHQYQPVHHKDVNPTLPGLRINRIHSLMLRYRDLTYLLGPLVPVLASELFGAR